jgi:DNA-binding transcriptional LysR family regulator
MPSIERISRRLKINDLQTFLAVVETGSMGKAARALRTSQSAVSRKIADLEHAFGVQLFDRNQSGIELTSYGRELMRCGMVMFDDLRQGIRNLEYLRDPTVGEIRVGTSEPLSTGIVAAAVERLSRGHPKIVLHITIDNANALHRELEERRVDVIVCRTLQRDSDHFNAEPLFDETYVVAAGARNRWVHRRRIAMADLVDEPWTLAPMNSLPGAVAAEAFAANRLRVPDATVFSHSVHLRNRLLDSGRFLTLFPGAMLQFPSRRTAFRILDVKFAVPSWTVAAITLRNRTLSPVVQMFVACAREVAKQKNLL